MFNDLDLTLRAVLSGPSILALIRAADVEFASPTEAYAPASPTINLFLYDVRERTA